MAGRKQGSWCHIEIPCASPQGAKKFYGKVFGWNFQDAPALDYVLFSTGDGEIGGGLWNPPPGIPRVITNYISVEHVDTMVARVQEHGGKLVRPRMEVPGHGWFALVADPDGNIVGLWQDAPQPPISTKAVPKSKPKAAMKLKPRKRK